MPDATSTFAAPVPRFPTSQTMIGAVSPLWSYFAGAALVGTAWWWMSRWSGLAAAAPPAARGRPAAPKPAVLEPPPAAVEPPPVVVEPLAVVESASTIAEAPKPAPLIEAPPLPAVEAAAEPRPAPAPTPKPRKPKDEPKPH